MPAVPHKPSSSQPLTHPRDPNVPPEADHDAHASRKSPSHQPSPAVIDTSSHSAIHVLPRRFLGPLPPQADSSAEAQAKRSRIHRAKAQALERITGALEDGRRRRGSGMFDGGEEEHGLRGQLHRIKVLKRGVFGQEEEDEVEVDLDGLSEHRVDIRGHANGHSRQARKQGKGGKGKEKWYGESFFIGREFTTSAEMLERRSAGAISDGPVFDEPFDDAAGAGPSTGSPNGPSQRTSPPRGRPPARPAITAHSTQDTFVTARTEFTHSPSASSSRIDLPEPDDHKPPRPSGSTPSLVVHRSLTHQSKASSLQPLLGEGIGDDGPSRNHEMDEAAFGSISSTGLKRLKSAIRKPATSVGQGRTPDVNGREHVLRSKSVSFPFDPVQAMDAAVAHQPPRQGDRPPKDPEAVLAREGDDAQGTSAGAQEATLREDEWDDEEEDLTPVSVLKRDRMLVKIGEHRDEGIEGFDEAKQRRSPCHRLDPFEEFIVVWRLDHVQLYKEHSNPLIGRLKGGLKLEFTIPIDALQTSLAVFNEVDMSFSLTTSTSKLRRQFERAVDPKRSSTRAKIVRDKLKNSRQAQWLRRGKRGSQVFIFKLGERSRALDWYWEIWRSLQGELPTRIDIAVPSLGSSVRLRIPDDDAEITDETVAELSTRRIVRTCWEMMSSTMDVNDLLRQRKQSGGERLDLELAWKSPGGMLEWVAYATTTDGKKRDWAVLAGIAKLATERTPRTLQLRPAHHQPKALKMSDRQLEEPAGIEGYLTRHKTGTTPKQEVYVATHDGFVYTSTLKHAKPPLPPHSEKSVPADVFPEVHKEFMDGERRRMAKLIQHSLGGIDVRSIENVRLCEEPKDGTATATKKWESSFEVEMPPGVFTRFEASSRDVAKEWVERLQEISEYWGQRHRADARMRMDAMALQGGGNALTAPLLQNTSDEVLSDIWDWCTIKGCRSVALAGRLYLRKSPTDKFRARYVVLTGGSLVTFKIRAKQTFCPRQNQYPLFGAYTYSGMLAEDEVQETREENAFAARQRLYQDGLQSGDGAEDTTFCVRLFRAKAGWGGKKSYPWDVEDDMPAEEYEVRTEKAELEKNQSRFNVPALTKQAPKLLIFRARSKLERDRWVWALNAEMERQVRAHPAAEYALRHYGHVA